MRAAVRTLSIVLVTASACEPLDDAEVDSSSAEATAAIAPTQFVWPVAGWIVANTHYRSAIGVCDDGGNVHWTGSTDIAIPLMTNVVAARGGTVVDVGFRDRSGYYLELSHGGDVHTYYSHFARQPAFSVGQSVSTGQLIGVSGQTGHSSHPHLHFGIFVGGPYAGGTGGGTHAPIPDTTGGEIQCGDWVERGRFIPGDYGLPALTAGVSRSFGVTITSATLDVRASARSTAAKLGTLSRGTSKTVVGSTGGWYKVAFGTGYGYIAHSGTKPSGTNIFGVTVSSTAPTLRRAPGVPGSTCPAGSDCAAIPAQNPDGTANRLPRQGDLMAVFETSADATGRAWYRVVYQEAFIDPVDGAMGSRQYGWLSSADVRRSVLTTGNANVRRDPSLDGVLVGNVPRGISLTAIRGQLDERSPRVEWLRIFYTGTEQYEWTSSANVADVNAFEARVQVDLPVRSCASSSCAVLGRLAPGKWAVVREEVNGWYRIGFGGQTGWIVGWYTQGRAAGP